jgi:Arc/MetJ family transcription regulator
MKLTLNIDDDLLERVREATGAKTKTEAIHYALTEIDRRNRLRDLLAEDIGLTPDEWRNAFDESVVEDAEETVRVAEEPPRP